MEASFHVLLTKAVSKIPVQEFSYDILGAEWSAQIKE